MVGGIVNRIHYFSIFEKRLNSILLYAEQFVALWERLSETCRTSSRLKLTHDPGIFSLKPELRSINLVR